MHAQRILSSIAMLLFVVGCSSGSGGGGSGGGGSSGSGGGNRPGAGSQVDAAAHDGGGDASQSDGGGGSGGDAGTGSDGAVAACNPAGGPECTACAALHCNDKYADCYGADWQTGPFTGPCGASQTCFCTCASGDTACEDNCRNMVDQACGLCQIDMVTCQITNCANDC